MTNNNSASVQRVPVTLLTGFLGSGKTTLLSRAIRHPDLARTVVVINEFGEVSLDHSLVAASNDNIVVLDNGCMCCTVRGDLLATLTELHIARAAGEIQAFDHVIIETSGLADPTPVLQALLSEPALETQYRVAHIIATFDAVNGTDTLIKHDESVRQIAVADHVLITKLDLVAGDATDAESKLTASLRTANPAAVIEPVPTQETDIVKLLRALGFDPRRSAEQALRWLNADAYLHDTHDHDHEGHDHSHHLQDIASFCFVKEQPIAREALHLLLSSLENNLGSNLLRVKGLVNIAEEQGRPAVVQGAQHLLHNLAWLDAWPDADHRTRIVFIAQGIARDAVIEMIELLERVASRTAKARLASTATAPPKPTQTVTL
ncbi:MAG: GTP-binding protein [Steroidobacteraceae bacterium]